MPPSQLPALAPDAAVQPKLLGFKEKLLGCTKEAISQSARLPGWNCDDCGVMKAQPGSQQLQPSPLASPALWDLYDMPYGHFGEVLERESNIAFEG
eukprot:54293-Pelagomonas_calceolata.AAC.1